MDGQAFIIAGLGNPGREYRATRHNIGFMAIDELCRELSVRLSRLQSKALVGTCNYQEAKLVLAKPQTFMNLSGQSVAGLMRFYKVEMDHLLVIHDDLDLPLGTIRIRPGGGSAGQKGLGSIIQQLGTQEFPRLRLGIGRPPGRMDAADFVLQEFTNSEEQILKNTLERAVKAVQTFALEGLSTAMNQYNGFVD